MAEVDASLLDHDTELQPLSEEKDRPTLYHQPRGRIHFQVFVGAVLVPLTVFLILYLQWSSIFKSPWTKKLLTPHLDSFPAPTPERDLKLLLRPEDHVSRDPTTIYISWNITKGVIAPNGVEKNVFLINNNFPGPTIEVRSGDVLEIEVFNLAEEGISLHWHGLHMRGANDMDGPVGITQCAIQPGVKFTYHVPTDEQAGTFWYHAHSESQRGDGLWGGLIIHNPKTSESLSHQYDKELLFLVGDWYHWPSEKVLGIFMDRTSNGLESCPDSLLINGRGSFECSRAIPGAPVNCSETKMPWLTLDKKLRYRVRLINVGSLTGFSFKIPDSEMTVIEVDGGNPIIADETNPANSIGILYPAERVDLILGWPEAVVDTDTEITIQLDKEYFLRPNPALTSTQSFHLSAESITRRPMDNNTDLIHFNLQDAQAPALSEPLPDVEQNFVIYSSIQILNRLLSRPKGFVNHTYWESQDLPLISLNRESWNVHQLVPWTGSKATWVQLVINNIDGTGHPFHLHGHDFYVVASHRGKGGWDYYNPFTPAKPPRGGPFNLVNPLRKDTVYVPAWGYAAIQFRADNEGLWALHCHILWHQGSGMSMALQVLGDETEGFSASEWGMNARRLCVDGT